MTLTEAKVGDFYYVPFWTLLEYLDNSPNDPFIKTKILDIKTVNATTQDGVKQIMVCDLECYSTIDKKTAFIVNNVPTEYLIDIDSLRSWANKISQWFLEYPDHIKS